MLTSQQIARFERDGYLVVDGLLDKATVLEPVVSEYTVLLNSLIDQWAINGKLEPINAAGSFAAAIRHVYAAGLDYFQPMDISLPPGNITNDIPFHAGPAIFNLMTSAALLDVVESLIGPEITSNPIQHVRIKPPVTELDDDEIRPHIGATCWHQDRAVTLEEADATRMVTVWAAITDATIDNGCLQVIPGSHRGTLLQHCPHPQLAIPENQFDGRLAQPVPISAGSVILFHPLTVHSSLDNTSDDVRWSFDLRYNVTGDPTGRPMFPDFVARSRSQPETVLQSALLWKESWLVAREKLSKENAVEIHRWDGTATVCA